MLPEPTSIMITGAAVRVGRRLALHLAQQHQRLFLHYHRSRAQAHGLADELIARGKCISLHRADLACTQDVAAMLEQIKEKGDVPTVLIHNAAIFYPTPFFETTPAQCENLVRVNLLGPFYLLQQWVKAMAERTGQLIVIGDVGGIEPWTQHLVYSVTKAALMHLARSLARLLSPRIRVNVIAPGALIVGDEGDEARIERFLRAVDWVMDSSLTGKIVALAPCQESLNQDWIQFPG